MLVGDLGADLAGINRCMTRVVGRCNDIVDMYTWKEDPDI